MFKKTTILVLLLSTISIFSCRENNNNNEIIEINPLEADDQMKLSEIIDSVKYIKLQTDSICIMGRIHSIYIKEKYIYAFDISQKIIFVFEKNGKYISKLDKRGNGPDEYVHIGGVFIDDDEKFIDIIDLSRKECRILRYSNISFNLIDNSKSIPIIFAHSFRRKGDTYFFATQQQENTVNGKTTNAGLLVVKDGIIEKKLFDKTIPNDGASFTANKESFTLNDMNELFVSIMYDNSFYKLQDFEANPELTVDFGKYGMDNSIGLKPIKEQMEYYEKTKGVASFPVLDINNSNLLVFTYGFRRSKDEFDHCHYIKLKNINKIFHVKKIKNDITNFPEKIDFCTYNHIAHEAWYNDYLVDIVIPGNEFFDLNETKKTIDGLGEVTSEDNPIIILMKLKKEFK